MASFRSGLEALGEPAVDGLEQVVGFPDPPLVAHEPCIVCRSAQLPGLRLLLARPVERGEVIALRASQITFERKHPAFDPEGFSIVVPFFPARPLNLGDDFADQIERTIEIAKLRHSLGESRFQVLAEVFRLRSPRWPGRPSARLPLR